MRSASQERIKRELAALFQEISRVRPLVVFFDDLHWADVSTIDVLNYLSGAVRRHARAAARHLPAVGDGARPAPVPADPQRPAVARRADRAAARVPRSREDVERYLAMEFPEHAFRPRSAGARARADGRQPAVHGGPASATCATATRWSRRTANGGSRGSLSDVERELPESVRSMIAPQDRAAGRARPTAARRRPASRGTNSTRPRSARRWSSTRRRSRTGSRRSIGCTCSSSRPARRSSPIGR